MNQEKSFKSIGWVVKTILLRTVLSGMILIIGICLLIFIFAYIFVSKNSANAILLKSYFNPDFLTRLSFCILLAMNIIGTWLGVKFVVGHSLIRKEDFIKISIYTGLTLGLLAIPGPGSFVHLIFRFLFWSIFDALATYFWLKALIA
jgi:hypothetical protein